MQRTDLDHIFLRSGIGSEIRTKLFWTCWDSGVFLPGTGLLAGGSVASMILNEAWGGNFPIKDIDVFEPVAEIPTILPKMPQRLTEMILAEDADDEYKCLYKICKNGYQVLRSEMRGKLNKIAVRMLGNINTTEAAHQAIISGFDLNACQVGISLETDQLIFTEDFREFVSTGQLKITNLATPFHSAIRLAKKTEELGCYCDVNTELILLKSYVDAVYSLNCFNKDGFLFPRFFGNEAYLTYMTHKQLIEKNCYVFQGSNQLKLPKMTSRIKYYSMEINVPSVFKDIRPYFLGAGLPINSVSMIEVYDHLFRPTTRSTVRSRFAKAIIRGKYTAFSALQNKRFTKCDFHSKHLNILEQFAENHYPLYCYLNKFGLNVTEMLDNIRTIKRAVNKYGLFVIGLIEDKNNPLLQEARSITDELIEQLINQYRNSASSNLLVDPIDLSGFDKKHLVVELCSANQLRVEGIREKHCVGGYVDPVRNGDCRIFHLETRNVISTLQIRKNFSVGEHRIRGNKLPPIEHVNLASELTSYIRELDDDD